MARFQPGQSGNPKGRPRTGLAIVDLIRKRTKEGQTCVDELLRIGREAEDQRLRLDANKALLSFICPKLQAIELTGPDGGPVQVEKVIFEDATR